MTEFVQADDSRFAQLFETMPDGVIVANRTGNILLVNQQAEQIFGYSKSEFLALSVDTLLPERFRKRHVGHRQGFDENPHVRKMGAGLELFGIKKDGSEFPVEISLSPVIYNEDNLIIAAIRDVTDVKDIENALKELNQSLEQKVEERTAELATANVSLDELSQERGELYTALLDAQEEERTRISRDLHDSVGQSLTGILLYIDELEKQVGGEKVFKVKDLAVKTLDDVRKISQQLRPALLDSVGLDAALKQLSRELSERSSLNISVVSTISKEILEALDDDKEITLFRIAQESLTNVMRHAGATEASVILSLHKDKIQLSVEDDGKGFDSKAKFKGHLGLVAMRERLELVGGEFNIESEAGTGTVIYARIPLSSEV